VTPVAAFPLGTFCFNLDPFADVLRLQVHSLEGGPGYVYDVDWFGDDVYRLHGGGTASGGTPVLGLSFVAQNDSEFFGDNRVVLMDMTYSLGTGEGFWVFQALGVNPPLQQAGTLVPISCAAVTSAQGMPRDGRTLAGEAWQIPQ
jgi:hypothetical protein